MQFFNYASYAKAFEKGVSDPNMTMIAKALFEPIISADHVLNRNGNIYVIDSKYAKAWYDQTSDIPGNIKKATGRQDVIERTIDYFSTDILDNVVNQNQEAQLYSALNELIEHSDLEQADKDLLKSLYEDNEKAEFLARAFLLAVVGDNLKKSSENEPESLDEDLRKFKELIQKSYKKPVAIEPPDEIEDHELGYVRELYRVYSEISGKEYIRPEELPKRQRRHFNEQRKDYYKAETIHRELRDTIRMDEPAGFSLLKDEIYDGVITTRNKIYATGYDCLTAVTEHATLVPLSNNLQDRVLDWVGAGEKKGVCHMLVNDERLSWVEEDDDE